MDRRSLAVVFDRCWQSCDVFGPKPKDAYCTRNVLDCLLAEIGKRKRKLIPYLIVCSPRNTDSARFAERLKACRDIDAVTKNIFTVDDDIADVNTDTKDDLFIFRNACVAAQHATLNANGTAYCI